MKMKWEKMVVLIKQKLEKPLIGDDNKRPLKVEKEKERERERERERDSGRTNERDLKRFLKKG